MLTKYLQNDFPVGFYYFYQHVFTYESQCTAVSQLLVPGAVLTSYYRVTENSLEINRFFM